METLCPTTTLAVGAIVAVELASLQTRVSSISVHVLRYRLAALQYLLLDLRLPQLVLSPGTVC